jgi:GTP-binding protein EngB required for normal cell division/NTP pyrophosphatase (non-canonical NTP hydrolase)
LTLARSNKSGEERALHENYITLNPSQRQHLLITCKHIDKLLGDVEETLNAAASKSVFPNYASDITPLQRKTIEDYIARLRGQLLQVLAGQSLAPEKPRISAFHSIHVGLTFVEIAIAELAPHYMRGYGPVSEDGATDLHGIVAELQSAVKELHRYILQPQSGDLSERVEKLADQGWDVAALYNIAEIIGRHGLTEFRPAISMLLDRAEDTALEIAIFGRVSTGKSSLLNHVIGADLLPVGVTPITAVPTRIGYGQRPSIKVWQEGRGTSEHNIQELGSFVDERLNPENQKRVGRILVLYPSERLREGIILVDTPGIGSLATSSAAETLNYLPRCDAGIVLVDAGSTLTPDDLKIVGALNQASTATTVLISKADLLSAQDLEQQTAYVKRQLHTEFGTDLEVRPVSVMPSHADLLEQWFAEELVPLYERKQRMLQESLARKTLGLASAVRSALEMGFSYAGIEGEDRLQFEEVDLELRRSAGDLQKFHSELRRTTEEITLLAPFIVNRAAASIANIWPTENHEVDCAEVLRGIAAEVAGEISNQVRAKLLKLGAMLQQELLRTATLLRSADMLGSEDFQVLAEMPAFHMNRQGDLVKPPILGRLGRWSRIHSAKHRLQVHESDLRLALESFSRLLYAWGLDASTDLERRFDSFANRYRAQLERLLLDRKQSMLDADTVKSDLGALSNLFVADAPTTNNEAIAS